MQQGNAKGNVNNSKYVFHYMYVSTFLWSSGQKKTIKNETK